VVLTPCNNLYGGADKVRAQYRWHPNLPIEKERRAREEFRTRYGHEYYAMPSENQFEMRPAQP
jgi:hypothetical protein